MTAGILATCVILLTYFHGNIFEIWAAASQAGHTVIVRDMADFNTEYSLWAILLGTLILNLFDFGGNQVTVQRYLTASSSRETVKGLLFSAGVIFPFLILLFMAGLGLFVYYQKNPALMQSLLALVPENPAKAQDRVFAHFITHAMPSGLAGLVVSGIVAAGLSSADSGFNSLSAICFTDFYKRFSKKHLGEAQEFQLAKRLSFLWGILCTALALVINQIGLLVEVANKIYSYFVGPLIALFFLGLYVRRVNGTGAILGILSGLLANLILVQTTAIHFLWYAPFSFGTTLITAILFSFLIKSKQNHPSRRLTGAQGGEAGVDFLE